MSRARLRPTRRGFSLLVVMVLITVGLVLVSINQKRIASLLRLERATIVQEDFEEGPVQVMSDALELLETGLPPTTTYSYVTSVNTEAGLLEFEVVYTRISGDDWTVDVFPRDPAHSLPPMPATFAN